MFSYHSLSHYKTYSTVGWMQICVRTVLLCTYVHVGKPTSRANCANCAVPIVPRHWRLCQLCGAKSVCNMCPHGTCANAKIVCANCAVATASVTEKRNMQILPSKANVPIVPWQLCQLCQLCRGHGTIGTIGTEAKDPAQFAQLTKTLSARRNWHNRHRRQGRGTIGTHAAPLRQLCCVFGVCPNGANCAVLLASVPCRGRI